MTIGQLPLQAKILDSLNKIVIPVSDQSRAQRTKAINLAFQQVLVRYTGLSPESILSTIKSNRISATSYLQRFQYQEIVDVAEAPQSVVGTEIVLIFDPIGITNLLNQLNLPEWSENRPELLLWIAIGDKRFRLLLGPDHREQIRDLLTRQIDAPFSDFKTSEHLVGADVGNADSENPDPLDDYYLKKVGTEEDLLSELNRIADERGLPIILPLLDLQDNMSLDSADVWAQFVSLIRSASERYQPDAILAGKIELVSEGWLMDWILMDDSTSEAWQGSATTLADALYQGLGESIIRIAQRFAVVQDSSSSQTLEIAISGIQSATDLANLETYLGSQAAISAINMSRLKGTEVRYRVSLIGELSSLLQSIRLEQRLTEVQPSYSEFIPGQVVTSKPAIYFEWNG